MVDISLIGAWSCSSTVGIRNLAVPLINHNLICKCFYISFYIIFYITWNDCIIFSFILWFNTFWTPSGSRRLRPSILLSDLLSCLSKSFHGIVSLFFSKFRRGARIPCEVVRDRAGFLGKNFFAQKIGKLGQKQGFFNLLESFVINFYWIWSIMKIYIICSVLVRIPYLGKFLYWDLCQNVLSQSDCRIY